MNWAGVGFAMFLVILSSAIGGYWNDLTWEKKAIEQGCARYNPQTGDFEWIEN